MRRSIVLQRDRLLLATVLLALLAPAGCGGTRADPMRRAGGERESIELRVNNLNFNEATVTAVTSGSRVRIGIVAGKASQTFTVAWPSLQELRIQISVLAGGSYTTPGVTVGPGERVELLIQENVRASQLRR